MLSRTPTEHADLNQQTWLQLVVGTAFVAVVALMVWIYRPSLQASSEQAMVVQASFPFVDGVALHTDVLMLGIKVGSVHDIQFIDETYQAVTLTLWLDHPDILSGILPIPDDSNIRIVTPSIFGSKVLWIEPGASFSVLEDGDSFLYTQGSFVIDDFLRMIMSR